MTDTPKIEPEITPEEVDLVTRMADDIERTSVGLGPTKWRTLARKLIALLPQEDGK